MAIVNPPLWMQGGSHPAVRYRRGQEALWGSREGIVNADDLVVTDQATPDMSINVGTGFILVSGTEASYQGMYLVELQGTPQLVYVSASHATFDRYDLVVVRVWDATYGTATQNQAAVAVVTGTPAASPKFPAIPDNSFVLATILVEALTPSITQADITDIRDGSDSDGTTTLINRGLATPKGGTIMCTSATHPWPSEEGMVIYETDTGLQRVHNGTGFITPGAERGQWTPTFTSDGTPQTPTREGSYRRVGDDVFFDIAINSATTIQPNEIKLLSLPFDMAAGLSGADAMGWSGTFWHNPLMTGIESSAVIDFWRAGRSLGHGNNVIVLTFAATAQINVQHLYLSGRYLAV